jgi:hypothetical protein
MPLTRIRGANAPLRTLLEDLPSISVANGQTRTSPSPLIGVGTNHVQIELDGSGWNPNAEVTLRLEIATDGVNFKPVCGIAATKASLIDGWCDIGVTFPGGNQNTLARIRAVISCTGAGITVAGNLSVA